MRLSQKHKNNSSKDARTKYRSTLEVIYSGVSGPIQVDPVGGNKYIFSFLNDFSRKLWTCLIKKKNDVIDVFSEFKSKVERKSGP